MLRLPLPAASPLFAVVLAALLAACGTDGTVEGPPAGDSDASASSGGTSSGGVGDASSSGGASSGGASSGGASGGGASSGGASSGGASSGGSSGGGVCGDGQCTAGENNANCPLDCKEGSGGQGPFACIAAKCGGFVTQCKNNDACAAWMGCAEKCGDSSCVAECALFAPAITQQMQRVMQCGKTNGCLAGGGGGDKPVCGNGKCEEGETPENCGDCKGPDKPVCGDGVCAETESPASCAKDCGNPGPWCGNGKCEPGESSQTCAKDCEPPVQSAVECAQKSCPTQFKACLSVGACAAIIQCIAGCKSDACLNGCVAKASNNPEALKVFNPLAQCAQQHKCGAGAPQPFCGNGNCESGETHQSCKSDCKPPPGPVCGDKVCQFPENEKTCAKDCFQPSPSQIVKCVSEKCSAQWGVCSNAPACAKVLACLKGCGDSEKCLEKCMSTASQQAFPQLMPLMQCAEKSGCVPGGGGGQCGDGQCSDGENPQNCPQDCSGGGTGTCQGKCGGQGQGGKCWCDKQCVNQNDCCPDYFKLCTDSQPVCGNGKCEAPSETQKSCPKDCPPDTKPVCGNGQCEIPFENPQNCPKDCQTDTKPVCGNGKCEAPFENANNCAKDCQTTKPFCGDGKCDKGNGEDALTCPKDCTKPGGSCKDKCGGNQGGCWCDQICVQTGDCCPDYQKYCSGPTIVCGDGKCEAPFENAKNCPKDCQADQPKKCKTIKDCADGQVCCNKGDQGQICVKAGTCN